MDAHSYTLIDCGDGQRLERFGGVIVSRPAPAAAFAPALPPERWHEAALSFTREDGWLGDAPADWRVAFGPAVLGLRPARGGQVGVFPEHAAVADALDRVLAAGASPENGYRALNLFAHTGLATLRLAARADVGQTVHVDAAPASVRQAKENAAASGLSDRPIRWLVDDTMAFLGREMRRRKVYDVILADPPAYGRSKSGGEWKLERDLPALLAAMAALLPERGGILCLSCHRDGWNEGTLRQAVSAALPWMSIRETAALALRPASGGRALPSGFALLAETPR